MTVAFIKGIRHHPTVSGEVLLHCRGDTAALQHDVVTIAAEEAWPGHAAAAGLVVVQLPASSSVDIATASRQA